MRQRPREQRTIARTQCVKPATWFFVHCPQKDRRHCRHVRQREQERAYHGDAHGKGHRLEHAAFQPFQCEDRHVHRDDDANAEHNRSTDFKRGSANDRGDFARWRTFAFTKTSHEIFDHHDGRVDHEAKVERAETHEICRNVEPSHENEGNQQRQRNHRRHDQRRADIAKEEKENERDEQCALEQIAKDRTCRSINNVGLTVERADRDTGRE